MMKALPLAAALIACVGCASVETNDPNQAREETVYRTGSNIPQKRDAGPSEVKVYDKEAIERSRDATITSTRSMSPGGGPAPR